MSTKDKGIPRVDTPEASTDTDTDNTPTEGHDADDGSPEDPPEGEGTPEGQDGAEEQGAPSPLEALEDLLKDNDLGDIYGTGQDAKGVDVKEVLSSLPPEGRRIIEGIRSDYTRKTQSLAEQRKELERAKAEIEANRRALTDSDWAKDILSPTDTDEEPAEIDPFNPDTFKTAVEQAAERKAREQVQQMVQAMRQEQAKADARAQLQKFQETHPDFEDRKPEVVRLLKGNKNLSVEDAYWIVRGRHGATAEEEERAARRKTAHRTGAGMSRTRRSPSEPPQEVLEQGPMAIYKWHQANGGE